MEIQTIRRKTIKIGSISKDDFFVSFNDDDIPSIKISNDFCEKNNFSEEIEEEFLIGMISVFVKHFPKNGKLKVEL